MHFINPYLHEFFEPIQSIKFLVHGRKGNLAVFESSNISETGEATSTKIGVHAFDINPYLHELFNQFYSLNFFTTMDYNGLKGKFGQIWKKQYLQNMRGHVHKN